MPLSPTYHTYISRLLPGLYLHRPAYCTYCTHSTYSYATRPRAHSDSPMRLLLEGWERTRYILCNHLCKVTTTLSV